MTREEINRAKLKNLGYDAALKACDIHVAHFKRAKNPRVKTRVRELLHRCVEVAIELRKQKQPA